MIVDTIQLTSRRITPEGYLAAEGVITKVGVQQYLGSEIQGYIDEALEPMAKYNVYRPATTVFDSITINSAKLMPMTDSHPHNPVVDADTNKMLSIGNLGENVRALDSERLGCNILVTDAMAVQKIMNGTHGLSPGYTSHITKQSGAYNGTPFDFIFDEPMQINHLALVAKGRGGSEVRILDNKVEGNMPAKTGVNNITDVDMSGVLSQVVTNLQPAIEKIVSGDDFQNKLASLLAEKLSASFETPVDGADGEVADQDSVEPTNDPATQNPQQQPPAAITDTMQNVVAAAANNRADIILASKALNAEVKTDNCSNRMIMLDALSTLKIEGLEKKGEQYLRGILDNVSSKQSTSRREAQSYLDSVGKSESMGDVYDSYPSDGFALRAVLNNKSA
jgi:hypothetical protein